MIIDEIIFENSELKNSLTDYISPDKILISSNDSDNYSFDYLRKKKEFRKGIDMTKSDLSYVMFTSGSTGEPQMVVVPNAVLFF